MEHINAKLTEKGQKNGKMKKPTLQIKCNKRKYYIEMFLSFMEKSIRNQSKLQWEILLRV